MMKKTKLAIIFGLLLLLVNPFTFSLAQEKIKIEKAKKIVNEYIRNGFEDKNWKDNSPRISDSGTFYYTDNTNTPSYIEFQITCEREKYCGFIIVNIDGNDAGVPIASTIGSGPAKVLTREGEEGHTKMYYFGPIVQYSYNQQTGEVFSIDPQDYQTERKDAPENQRYLQEKFQEDLQASIEFKNSPDFQEQVEELKKEKQVIQKDEFARNSKLLDMSYAYVSDGGVSTSYTPPAPSNKMVPGENVTAGCYGQVPCYEQYNSMYGAYKNGVPYPCKSGCVPTAMAILYGYHDNHDFPDILSETDAPMYWEETISMRLFINSLRFMTETTCGEDYGDAYAGITENSKIQKAISYAKLHYPNSEAIYSGFWNKSVSAIYMAVKEEVNANRPIILHSSNHAFVGYGYNTKNNVVRVNMGWGTNHFIIGYDTANQMNIFFTTVIDYNIGALYYRKNNNDNDTAGYRGPIRKYTKFHIKP